MLVGLRIVVLALAGALVMIGNGLYLVEGERAGQFPPLWVVATQVGWALAMYVLIEVGGGYRVPPIPPGTPQAEARKRARNAFILGIILRSSLAESVAIASIGLGFFVGEGVFVTYLVGFALALVLLAAHAWPGNRSIRRTQDSLERDGARSYLREELGIGGGGPIQEL